jgi:hypothetical protein
MAAVRVFKRTYCGNAEKNPQNYATGRAGFARLWKRKSRSDAPQARFGRCVLAEDISNKLGGGKRLFADGTIPAAFKVTESTVTSKGVITVNYERAGPTGSL